MTQVSFQGIGKSPLPSMLTCYPCCRSKLLPMSPVYTEGYPLTLTLSHEGTVAKFR
jgi:hypothetical protein